jgi:hypothetical protein
MTVVRHVGPWKGRWYRAVAAVQSAWMFAVVWHRMPWHYRMTLLSEWEEISAEERRWFPEAAGRHLRRAMFGMRLGSDTEELEAMQGRDAETLRMIDERPRQAFDAAARDAARTAGLTEDQILDMFGPPPDGEE